VVVSYRCPDLLGRCLESLRQHPLTSGPTTVHVVDNASGDATAQMVRGRFPEIRFHLMPDNVGFSRANNHVLRDSEARYVLLLNPDTEVREGTLDHMVELMDARGDVGMAGCRLVQPDGMFDHAAKRGFPTPTSALAHFASVGRRDGASDRLAHYRAPGVDETGVGEVDAVNGAFMLVRVEAMRAVGLLDEGYWLYMEDLDWCKRFQLAGWKVLYDGRVETLHVKGGAAGKHRRLRQNVAFHQGMARFYRKFDSGKNPLLDAAVYLGIFAKLAVSATRSGLARGRLAADRRTKASPAPTSTPRRAAPDV